MLPPGSVAQQHGAQRQHGTDNLSFNESLEARASEVGDSAVPPPEAEAAPGLGAGALSGPDLAGGLEHAMNNAAVTGAIRIHIRLG